MTRIINIFKNFDGRYIPRDALALNFFMFSWLLIQYIYFPTIHGIYFVEESFTIFLLSLFIVFSFLGMIFHKLQPVNVINSFTLFFSTFIFLYVGLFLNGPFNVLIFIIVVIILVFNVAGMIINGRLYWRKGKRKNFLIKLDWKKNAKLKAIKILVVIGIIVSVGITAYNSFWIPFSITPPKNAKTISSYWGPPSVNLSTWSSLISPVDNETIQVSNSTLNEEPPGFEDGTFAFVINVSVAGNQTNFANYSNGARSYPNGTIILSEPLPSLANVNITFKYVTNIIVFKALQIGNSTLIMNYHEDDYFSTQGFFDAIFKTYLFQMLDYWDIKYYLNVESGDLFLNKDGRIVGDFPHIFNYNNTVPRCYQLLNWVKRMSNLGYCKNFQGISLDFEPGGRAVPGEICGSTNCSSPGGTELFPGSLIPENYSDPLYSFKRAWYNVNEQNSSLYTDAFIAYEGVYDYASYLGYKTYIVFGGGELRDIIDGDLDYTRCPTFPITRNPDVIYGIMNYQDSNVERGRYRAYKGCIDQIKLLGDKGRTILLGWLTQEGNPRWYTHDEQGFQNYVDDCYLAQAAGITEIYHAALYRMQAKWGDDSILRLHEYLNNGTKRTISFKAPAWEFRDSYLVDYLKNFNGPVMFSLFIILIIFWIMIFGSFNMREYFKPLLDKKKI
ncbi:MAG: hypothetical protein ACTSVI_12625 [Promethearchaeota archaeon]